jgi:hypothetical protein
VRASPAQTFVSIHRLNPPALDLLHTVANPAAMLAIRRALPVDLASFATLWKAGWHEAHDGHTRSLESGIGPHRGEGPLRAQSY